MARMVPSQPGGRDPNDTEVRMFEKLKTSLPDWWIVMHHVGIQRHPRKPLAEIDFLLIAGPGIFCLEVKGGLVRCEAGVWKAGSRELKESPFTQVGGAGAALRSELPDAEPFVFGWGCMFPDGKFSETGPEISPEIVYDADDLDPRGYIERLADYWGAKYPNKQSLGRRDVETIAHQVRPDFEMQESLLPTVVGAREELIAATHRQVETIRASRETDRLVIRGGAGTGKTWIAASEAVRMAEEGTRVLLTCFNVGLARHLASRIRHSNLTISHLDGLMDRLIDDGGTRGQIPADADDDEKFDTYRPLAAIEGAEASGMENAFEAVIVDEAQDLLVNQKIDVLDCLLEGGIEDGVWRVLWDPVQTLFGSGAMPRLSTLSKYGARFETVPLDLNCRNTAPIARRVEVLADQSAGQTAFAEGPEPIDREWDGTKVQGKKLREILNDWIQGGLEPGHIMILSTRKFENSVASSDIPSLPAMIADVSREPLDASRRTVGFATIHAFKGLEAEAVVLVDVDDISSSGRRALMYVGATRARSLLAVLRHDGTTEEFAQRLASQSLSGETQHHTPPEIF